MSMRDQLMKSGLASKEQAKKAQREVAKQQHKKIQESRTATPGELSAAEKILQTKKEADRERSLKANAERLQKEADARVLDIIASHDLSESFASEHYYFLVDGKRIAKIMVNEEQIDLLEKGLLAIVSRDIEKGYVLLSAENAAKIAEHHAHFIICQHKNEDAQS